MIRIVSVKNILLLLDTNRRGAHRIALWVSCSVLYCIRIVLFYQKILRGGECIGLHCEYVLYLLGMILYRLMSIMIRIVSARNDILSPLNTTRRGTYSIALWISWYVLYLIKMILDHLVNILIYIVSARNDMLLPLNTTRGGTYKIALWISWYVLYLLAEFQIEIKCYRTCGLLASKS